MNNLSYELCKRLKDAGFPQKFDIGRIFFSYSGAKFGNVGNLLDGSDKICIPTLEELIEACGNKFGQLFRISNLEGETQFWQAFASDIRIFTSHCKTPKEAVAELWLKLNEK